MLRYKFREAADLQGGGGRSPRGGGCICLLPKCGPDMYIAGYQTLLSAHEGLPA